MFGHASERYIYEQATKYHEGNERFTMNDLAQVFSASCTQQHTHRELFVEFLNFQGSSTCSWRKDGEVELTWDELSTGIVGVLEEVGGGPKNWWWS